MRKFSILHLSDLHITNNRNTYPSNLKKLISDVAKETKHIDSLVLVVTGDIIDKANFKDAADVAVSFFSELQSKLNGKIQRIYFTPGNHDKNRLGCSDMLQKYFSGMKYEELYDEFEQGDWKNLFSQNFSDYISLLKAISKELDIEINQSLYYCDVFKINDCYVRLNSINSSLTSFNDDDYGSLHIGRFQIDKIEQDYDNIKSEYPHIDVSITIMHHPTFWLCKEEYDSIHYSISSPDSLATDVLLRGHTHDRSLENYYSLYNSFSTLVTGIGASNNDDNHPQRYSIYTFMCDLNLIEIVMKSSSEKGFIPDYSAYVSEVDESRKKIHFPMHVHDFISDTYLKLPLANGDFQPIYPTKDVFERITDYSNKLLELKERLANIIFTYKQQFILSVKGNDDSLEELGNNLFKQWISESDETTDKSMIEKILDENKNTVLNIINGLLYEFCSEVANVFFVGHLKEKEQVRVQFRVFNHISRSHEGLTNHSYIGDKPNAQMGITPVPWENGLIEKSFSKKVPLIYSLNKDYIKKDRMEETNWLDYFSYAPDIATNSYYFGRSKKAYPAISFGINCNYLNSYLVFETMSLLPFKSIIDDFLLNIHDSFKFSFESFVK